MDALEIDGKAIEQARFKDTTLEIRVNASQPAQLFVFS
jgi:hypothetical protein